MATPSTLACPALGITLRTRSGNQGESLWTGNAGRANAFAVRHGPSVRIRSQSGEWKQVDLPLAPFDSMMTHCSDPRDALELLLLRERMRDWRFYDHFRTDPDAPARRRRSAPTPGARQ